MLEINKVNKKAAAEAILWIVVIVATIVVATQFSWVLAQSILQYILIFSAGMAVYLYISNRKLYTKSLDQNKKLIIKQREISRFQKTVDLIFENSADGIIILDEEQKVESFSPGMERISGYKKEEALGRDVQQLLKFQSSSGDSLLPDLMFMMPGVKKESPYVKNSFVSRDGKNVDIEASFTTVKGSLGSGPKALAIIRDISYEKALIDRDKEFIAVTSHQLNTPLSIIRGYSAMLSGKKLGTLNQKQQEYMHQIHESVEKMYNLTSNLLSISRLEQDKINLDIQEVNVANLFSELTEQYTHSFSAKPEISVNFEETNGDQMVMADAEKLKQVLTNLVDNAIKYTEKGSVNVLFETGEDSNIFKVSDTGIGIPKEEIEKIGTRFYRSQNAINIDSKGTGLGVYIAKSIVEKHGGQLEIQSELNKGTTFTIKLPTRKE